MDVATSTVATTLGGNEVASISASESGGGLGGKVSRPWSRKYFASFVLTIRSMPRPWAGGPADVETAHPEVVGLTCEIGQYAFPRRRRSTFPAVPHNFSR